VNTTTPSSKDVFGISSTNVLVENECKLTVCVCAIMYLYVSGGREWLWQSPDFESCSI